MKTLQFFLPFLLFILTTTQSIPSTTADDVVYDVDGEMVAKNASYYIGPVIWASGGGVKLFRENNTCPFYVVQDPGEINRGRPFAFIPTDPKEEFILLNYPLGINAGTIGICRESPYWQIKPPSNFITTGGLFPTAESCFRVVKYPNPSILVSPSYMLEHCPYLCGAGFKFCYNVGIYNDKGIRYLASSVDPFEIVFKKASPSSASL